MVDESLRVLPLREKKKEERREGGVEGERRESLRSWKVRIGCELSSSRVRVRARFRDLTSGDRMKSCSC